MRRCQFSLRQLLLFTLALCVFLGWWFHPYIVEESVYNGAMTFKYRVRRHWNGSLHHYGPVRMFYENGTKGAESVVYGAKVGDVGLMGEGVTPRYWKDDGTEVSFEEWFMFVSLEYLPMLMHGESLRE